jgi:hypothetical protein
MLSNPLRFPATTGLVFLVSVAVVLLGCGGPGVARNDVVVAERTDSLVASQTCETSGTELIELSLSELSYADVPSRSDLPASNDKIPMPLDVPTESTNDNLSGEDTVDSSPELLDSFEFEGACVPDCSGKECGPDGCGGTCGECNECVGGQCLCQPICGLPQMGCDNGCGGTCQWGYLLDFSSEWLFNGYYKDVSLYCTSLPMDEVGPRLAVQGNEVFVDWLGVSFEDCSPPLVVGVMKDSDVATTVGLVAVKCDPFEWDPDCMDSEFVANVHTSFVLPSVLRCPPGVSVRCIDSVQLT